MVMMMVMEKRSREFWKRLKMGVLKVRSRDGNLKFLRIWLCREARPVCRVFGFRKKSGEILLLLQPILLVRAVRVGCIGVRIGCILSKLYFLDSTIPLRRGRVAIQLLLTKQ